MNKVILMGNLAQGPEREGFRKARCRFTLAVSGVARGEKGAKVARTDFVPVLAFGRTADACLAHLANGSRVVVDGHLHEERWDTGQASPRSRLGVVAERVHFVAGARAAPVASRDAIPSATELPE